MKFSPLRPDLVISVGEDSKYRVWDVRQSTNICALSGIAGVGGGTEIGTFNNINGDLFALGGKDF